MSTGPAPTGPGPTGPGRPDQLPRVGEWVRDLERLLAQALAIVDRDVDPASLPGGNVFDICQATVGLHIESALRDLAKLGDLPSPPVGSAVQFPSRTPAEAERERIERGGFNPHTESPGPSSSAAPVAPGRGAGPGVLGHVFDALPALLLFALAAGTPELIVRLSS